MRVHSLSVTAFGPFAATVQVDLDALSRDGLFLLCGPTGAGKTSLLDAIAFALYGRVPGARGQEKRLRSDHASPGVVTEVVCELTLRGERVRITRRPEQVRPKARGNGTTKDQALLHVQRQVSGIWEPVSTRLDEGGDYLRDQVGLSPEQFWQVVLLPQGEFAEFLRAEPDQRAKVLETLFDAGRFVDVETWLADHARALAASRASAEDILDRLLHRIQQAAHGLPASDCAELPAKPAVPAIEDPDLVRAYLTRQLARAAAHEAATSREDEVTRARLVTAETGRDQGRRAVRAAERLLAVCQQRAALRKRSGQLAEQRARLCAAVAAEPLRPLLEADAAAVELVRGTASALTQAYSDLDALDVGEQSPVRLEPADQPSLVAASDGTAVTELRRWAAALRTEADRLAELESELTAVQAEEQSLVDLLDEQAQLEASLAELRKLSRQLPAALADLEVRTAAARVAAAGLDHLGTELRAAEARVQAASRAAELTKLIAGGHSKQVASERACLSAKAEWLSLREIRLAGIAAELAGQLADGQGCPVCGSAQHPAPAAPAQTIVTAVHERDAAERHAELESAAQLIAAQVCELRREFDVCVSVTEGAALSDLRSAMAEVGTAHADARANAERLPALIAEHADLLSGREELVVQTSRLAEAAAENRATEKALGRTVAARRRRLDKARGQDDSLAGRRRRLLGVAEAADVLELASTAHTAATAGLGRTRSHLLERLQRGDFAHTEAARTALLDEPVRDELASEIRAHEDSDTGLAAEFVAATAEFDQATAAMGWLVEGPESDELQTRDVHHLAMHARELRGGPEDEYAAAVNARHQAVAAISRARGIHSQVTELQVLVDQALTECGPLREASASAAALAALVAGGGANVMKMRLRSYVLAAQLEQVASAATARLRQMSSGRYGFVHSDDLRGGNRRSGLSVDILDSHTGTQRPTKTLSGGESFMAALALALGLADVVTAESGGISLDTLFVDEGFGSLDPEALDAVMTVLDELRQGGRVVGIVSHVEELRTRVPMQLQIQTTSQGSTVDQPELGIPEPSALAG